jgi:hypothetical protein
LLYQAFQETTSQAKKGLTKMLNRSKTKLQTNSTPKSQQQQSRAGAKLKKTRSAETATPEDEEVDDEVVLLIGETRSLPASQESAFCQGDIEIVVEEEDVAEAEETFESAIEGELQDESEM